MGQCIQQIQYDKVKLYEQKNYKLCFKDVYSQKKKENSQRCYGICRAVVLVSEAFFFFFIFQIVSNFTIVNTEEYATNKRK